MKHYAKLLSAVLSCALIGTSLFSSAAPAAFAEGTDGTEISLFDLYDSTNSAESKEAADDSDEAAASESAETAETASETAPEEDITTTDVTTTAFVTTTTEVPFNVFDIYNAHLGQFTTTTTTTTTTTAPQQPVSIYLNTNGIDVSQWNGDIDWSRVKKAGIDYAIVRAGYGKFLSQEDPKFDENITNAQKAGLDTGVYWYSYALTVDDAYREAEVCYEIIKEHDYTYPVYFDIEDPSQDGLSVAQISAIVDAFCSTIQSKGYCAGVYSYSSMLTSRIYSNVLSKYEVWVAHVGVSAPAYQGKYGAWQYSWKGSVDGISGDVDMDYSYYNYPYIVSPETYNVTESGASSASSAPASFIDKGLASGIDVSVWQGSINWTSVKNSGVSYAIIRAGYGKYASQKDKNFDANIVGAKNAGLDVGVYWYSYAKTAEEAVQEAEACYSVIKGQKLEYPVYFDIEDASINNLSKSELTAITDAFCSTMESKGYFVGVTSYTNFLNTKLDDSIFNKYDIWVAHYGVSKPTLTKTFGMWQYRSDGAVAGINTAVDCDYAYRDYKSIITNNHLNGY